MGFENFDDYINHYNEKGAIQESVLYTPKEGILSYVRLGLLTINILLNFAGISLFVRRFHDVGWSGWWSIITPFLASIPSVPGDKARNKYGEVPQEELVLPFKHKLPAFLREDRQKAGSQGEPIPSGRLHLYKRSIEKNLDFKGRCSRREFGNYILFSIGEFLLGISFALLVMLRTWITIKLEENKFFFVLFGFALVQAVVSALSFIRLLGFIVNPLAILSRRYHDLGWSAWRLLGFPAIGIFASIISLYIAFPLGILVVIISLICFFIVLPLWVIFASGDKGPNEYGPPPVE